MTYKYLMKIDRDDIETLQKMAVADGYRIELPGANYGKASLPSLLSDLAAAYRANPERVLAALRSAGVTGPGLQGSE